MSIFIADDKNYDVDNILKAITVSGVLLVMAIYIWGFDHSAFDLQYLFNID